MVFRHLSEPQRDTKVITKAHKGFIQLTLLVAAEDNKIYYSLKFPVRL